MAVSKTALRNLCPTILRRYLTIRSHSVRSDHNQDVSSQKGGVRVGRICYPTRRLADTEPTQFLVDLNTPRGQQSGLVSTSVVKCENLFTIGQSLTRRVIGSLPEASMARVDECLKASLGIP